MDSLIEIGCEATRIQSCVHINASTILRVNELLNTLRTQTLVLKADLETTVEIGTTNTSRANLERVRNLSEFSFHHLSTSKFPSSSIIASVRYICSLVLLLPPVPLSILCFLNLAFNTDFVFPIE